MNTTPFNLDGTIKASFFRGALAELDCTKNHLLTFQKTYATLMKLDSSTTGAIREIELMLAVVAQLKLDQTEDAKLRKARDKELLAKGFPRKQAPFEKMHKRHKRKD